MTIIGAKFPETANQKSEESVSLLALETAVSLGYRKVENQVRR
jgi:hypothetical protein